MNFITSMAVIFLIIVFFTHILAFAFMVASVAFGLFVLYIIVMGGLILYETCYYKFKKWKARK